jgi:dolichol kinase
MIEKLFIEVDFFTIFYFIIIVVFSVLISDFLERIYKNTHEEILRKLPHILIGITLTVSPLFLTKVDIIILSIILFLGVLVTKHTPFITSIFSIKRVTFGLFATPLALGIMAFLWLPENIISFVFGMLVLTFSDSLAALFGRFYGRVKIPYSSKTYIGSISFFITTFIITFFLSDKVNVPVFILIASILTGLEVLLIFGLDNLFLPIMASFLFYFLL